MSSSTHLQVGSASAIEVARACFEVGDYQEVLSIAERLLADSLTNEDRVAVILLKACALVESGKVREGRQVLESAGALIDSVSDVLKGKFYGQRAYIAVKQDRNNAALVDYEAARFYAQEAKDRIAEAAVRNNLAMVYCRDGRFDDAIAESDAAIAIGRQLRLGSALGRFYDQRAQILVLSKRYAEAIEYSRLALVLLDSHPSGVEARKTHGLALIGLGATYLEQGDPVASCKARREAAKLLPTTVGTDLMRLALQRADGHVSIAARELGVDHAAMIRFASKHSLDRVPSQRRARTLIQQK